jgi:hypothetical protein
MHAALSDLVTRATGRAFIPSFSFISRYEQPEGQWSTVCFYHFVPNDFAGSLD